MYSVRFFCLVLNTYNPSNAQTLGRQNVGVEWMRVRVCQKTATGISAWRQRLSGLFAVDAQ